jgi:glutathione-regulated potassium-efflux system ancillary protein KefC
MVLADSAIFLAAAVIAVPLCKRLGLGSVIGYLAAGAAIGPSGLGLVHEVESTMHFAEFGVVLLLFLIGLELQPSRLWKMRSAVFGMGSLQVGLTTLILALGAMALGLPLRAAFVAGFGLSLSSTAFAMQLLGEKHELASRHGQSAFGILLFQDLAAIPMLAVVPLLAPARAVVEGPAEGHGRLTQVAVTLGVIAALIVGGRFLLRPVFRIVASAKSHELSAAWALLVVVGTALIMEKIGLSMALGAFLAGVLLANSEYRHELEANIEPFKGLLLGLFFMAVGMAANFRVLATWPVAIVGLVVTLTLVKLGVLFLLGRLSKASNDTSVGLAVTLSQGGEFAFVLFGVAATHHVLEQTFVEAMVVVVTLSMVTTPLLFLARDKAFAWRAARGGARPYDTIEPEPGGHVIIAGYGRFGQIVSRILRLKHIPFTALEVSAAQVDFVRKFGSEIYYGDASRVDLLRAAKTEEASLFMLCIDDIDASLHTAKAVREHFPKVPIVARARNRAHAHALRALGVEDIVRETFFSSAEAARHMLRKLGLDEAEANGAVDKFVAYDEAALVEQFVHRSDEQALIAVTKKTAEDLEKIFEEDAKKGRV